LGLALQGDGRLEEAISEFHKATELEPDSVRNLMHLSIAYLLDVNAIGAAECARKVIDLAPKENGGHKLLAQALALDGRVVEAETPALAAMAMDPTDGSAIAVEAFILQTLGRMEDAHAHCMRSIALESRQGIAYFIASRCRKSNPDDRALIEEMSKLAADVGIDPREVELLQYALGKSSEDLGEFQQAMQYFDLANKTAYRNKFGEREFDSERHRQNYEFAKSMVLPTISSITQFAAIKPIFVVGMMRSGTSLTEQILSSHPDVSGAGEQRFWPKNSRRAFTPNTCIADGNLVVDLAEEYIGRLSTFASGKRYVVDKMPNNYMNIGLILAALPEARVIHVKRHPVDTCVSIYTTQNPVRIHWAHNKANIVLNYRRYLSLMEHWKRVVPANRMLEIQYEEMVSSPEPIVREMLEYCGLDWSEECLRPEENRKGVTTPSVWQVRQPFYRTSIGRWRKYEPWIGELSQLANDLSEHPQGFGKKNY
jgi:tetratricopeptide (TPR) repeat protein